MSKRNPALEHVLDAFNKLSKADQDSFMAHDTFVRRVPYAKMTTKRLLAAKVQEKLIRVSKKRAAVWGKTGTAGKIPQSTLRNIVMEAKKLRSSRTTTVCIGSYSEATGPMADIAQDLRESS